MVQLALAGTLDVAREFLLDLVIEDRVFAEPDVHAAIDLRRRELLLAEPEVENLADAGLVFVGEGGAFAFAEKFNGHTENPVTNWAVSTI